MSPAVVAAGVLVACGTYLLLSRRLSRIMLGLAVLSHAVVLVLLIAGGPRGRAPFVGDEGPQADPLPPALALTAIVISFGVTAFLAALAYRNWALSGDDRVEDDPEDRRVASLGGTSEDVEDARAAARAERDVRESTGDEGHADPTGGGPRR